VLRCRVLDIWWSAEATDLLCRTRTSLVECTAVGCGPIAFSFLSTWPIAVVGVECGDCFAI